MIIVLPRKVSNRKFCGCQKIGWRFARVPIEVISLRQLVKTQGFYGYVYLWQLAICIFMSSFCLLFVPPKRPKIVFFGLQKHSFYPPKDDVWHAKSYAFATRNLCFYIFNTDFWPNKRKYFAKWRKRFVTKKENEKCSQTLKK